MTESRGSLPFVCTAKLCIANFRDSNGKAFGLNGSKGMGARPSHSLVAVRHAASQMQTCREKTVTCRPCHSRDGFDKMRFARFVVFGAVPWINASFWLQYLSMALSQVSAKSTQFQVLECNKLFSYPIHLAGFSFFDRDASHGPSLITVYIYTLTLLALVGPISAF